MDVAAYDVLRVVTAAAVAKWPTETVETQREYFDRAEQVRTTASMTEAPLLQFIGGLKHHETPAPGAPLGFASLNGPFPAQPMLVEKYQDQHGFAQSVRRFVDNRGFYTAALEGFPSSITSGEGEFPLTPVTTRYMRLYSSLQ